LPDELTLALDASTALGSVAVIRGRTVIADVASPLESRQAERLMPAVVGALREAGLTPRDLTRIVCGGGPGSFTGLRIAAAIAKGLAMSLGIPLFAASSHQLIVAGAWPGPGRYLALLDAMRGERFAAVVEIAADGTLSSDGIVRLITAAMAADEAHLLGARRIGPDEELVASPRAAGVVRLLERLLADGPVSLDAWEPDYGRLAEAQVKWEAAHGRPLA
jgi:tRNA threonylcarbamoyladenosine biosynthesis protein TsaB